VACHPSSINFGLEVQAMQPNHVFIGVDVSAATLCCATYGSSAVRDLENSVSAIKKWLAQLPASTSIAVESTGRFHRRLVELAYAAGHQVFVLNAKDVYFFARSMSGRGKTDRRYAGVIARFLAQHHDALHPWTPMPERLQRLRELLRCRSGLANRRASLQLMFQDVVDLELEALALDRQLEALICRIDERMAALIAEDAQMSERQALLLSIAGIGVQGATMLSCLFSQIPFKTSDSVVAYSGLDPRPRESGTMVGRRRLSKRGPPGLRKLLFMCAMGACNSKVFKPMYQALKAKGFKTTQALVILARKLLRIAWSVWKTQVAFDASRLGAACVLKKA
jgi:transposase